MKYSGASLVCTLAVYGVLSLVAAPVAADVAAKDQVKPTKKLSRKELNKLNGVECRRVRETGSRVSKKVCTTRAQRAAIARDEERKLNDFEERAVVNGSAGGEL